MIEWILMASSHLLLGWLLSVLLSFLLNDPSKAGTGSAVIHLRGMYWVKEAGGSFVTSSVIHLWNLSSHLMPHDFLFWYWTQTISHSKRIIRKSACCSFDTRIIPRVIPQDVYRCLAGKRQGRNEKETGWFIRCHPSSLLSVSVSRFLFEKHPGFMSGLLSFLVVLMVVSFDHSISFMDSWSWVF